VGGYQKKIEKIIHIRATYHSILGGVPKGGKGEKKIKEEKKPLKTD